MAAHEPLVLQGWRDRLAYGQIRRAAARRSPSPWTTRPEQRRILVTLPHDPDDMRAAWKFLEDIQTPSSHVIPVAWGGTIVYAPASFIGTVTVLDKREMRPLTRLPKRTKAEALWAKQPDLAINLRPSLDLVSAYLIGASPAALRIGFTDSLAEPLYDLQLTFSGSLANTLDRLRTVLERFEPPALAFGPDW